MIWLALVAMKMALLSSPDATDVLLQTVLLLRAKRDVLILNRTMRFAARLELLVEC